MAVEGKNSHAEEGYLSSTVVGVVHTKYSRLLCSYMCGSIQTQRPALELEDVVVLEFHAERNV